MHDLDYLTWICKLMLDISKCVAKEKVKEKIKNEKWIKTFDLIMSEENESLCPR